MATIEIDMFHIEKGIKDVEKYAHKLDEAVDDALLELYQKADMHMTIEASAYGVSESLLHKTREINVSQNEFEIAYTSEYAPFVEYGTGIVGKQNPHPNPYEWSGFQGYDINGHGEDGWYYLDSLNRLRWTKGSEPKPIVYNTSKWAKTQITRILRKHIRRIKV